MKKSAVKNLEAFKYPEKPTPRYYLEMGMSIVPRNLIKSAVEFDLIELCEEIPQDIIGRMKPGTNMEYVELFWNEDTYSYLKQFPENMKDDVMKTLLVTSYFIGFEHEEAQENDELDLSDCSDYDEESKVIFNFSYNQVKKKLKNKTFLNVGYQEDMCQFLLDCTVEEMENSIAA